jgi:hypothetical protein
MTFDEYEAVATIEVLDTPARRVLAAGRVPEDRVILEVPRAWLTHLIGFITSEANHTRSKKKAALYEAVLDRAEGVV